MAVPAWTKEWRALVKQLCDRMVPPAVLAESIDEYTGEINDCSAIGRQKSSSNAEKEQRLVLVDRVVSQLYSHRFLDTIPAQVQQEVDGLAAKFRVHSLEERADGIRKLAASCDYLVLKLLLEMADNPTAASDDTIQVDDSIFQTWQDQEATIRKEEKQLQEQMIEELFEISTNDEWYKEWNDDSDDSDGIHDTISDDEDDPMDSDKRDHMETKELVTSIDMIVGDRVPRKMQHTPPHAVTKPYASTIMWNEESVRVQDELLMRYYSQDGARMEPGRTRGSHEDMVDEGEQSATVDGEVDLMKVDVSFSMDQPWTLYPSLVYSHNKAQKRHSATESALPHQIIHERTVVNAAFQALRGVESDLFEFQPVTQKMPLLCTEFRTFVVKLSSAARNIAVGHLSPLALYRFLQPFSQAASNIQTLRDFVNVIRRDCLEEQRCLTLEGLAHALTKVIWKFQEAINDVEMRANSPTSFPNNGLTSTELIYADPQKIHPTLLGVFGALKGLFGAISWVKDSLSSCFQNGQTDTGVSMRAKCVLSSLYDQLQAESIQYVDNDSVENSSRYDILLDLFVGALNPYLDALNGMLFERSHLDSIALHEEVFFVTPPSVSSNGVISPIQSERNQTFADALKALAPFKVNSAATPTFLLPVLDLMNEALASRQTKNRYHQQNSTTPSVHQLQHKTKESLSELFSNDMQVFRRAAKQTVREQYSTAADWTAHRHYGSMLNYVPFSRIMDQCLTKHIKQKCRYINQTITDIFREKLRFLEHVDSVRLFVLMQQQDVFSMVSTHLMGQIQSNPISWADGEEINGFYQSAIQRMLEDNMISESQRQIGSRICIRVNATQLKSTGMTRKIDISAMKCLYFTFSTPQPLRILFGANIMRKYSRLATFLLQVKAVESAIVKFKKDLRHYRCFAYIERDIRGLLLHISDMLHYTKSLLNYLTTQLTTGGEWLKYKSLLENSSSLAKMNEVHEQYLDHLLNRFFLLDKHTTVIQYILTTFNHIMRFVNQVNELVNVVERNFSNYFPQSIQTSQQKNEENSKESGSGGNNQAGILWKFEENSKRREEIMKSAKEFKRQSHFLVVMLTAMQKHGASPHVAEILQQLNYNYFYHHQEPQFASHVPHHLRAMRHTAIITRKCHTREEGSLG